MVDPERLHSFARFDCTREQLYAYHERPGALERLTPPWERVDVVDKKGGIEPGGEVTLRIKNGPLTFTWIADHVENVRGYMFRDVMRKGPFASWSHTHRFHDDDGGGAVLEDDVNYRLPLQGLLPGSIRANMRRRLQRTFASRTRVLRDDLALHLRYEGSPMKRLISGASGMLGSVLVPLLTTGGHEVWTLVRREADAARKEMHWDPAQGEIGDLSGFDAVIHLAGEYIGLGRWSKAKKKEVFESRIKGTGLLSQAIVEAKASGRGGPTVFLSASATGFYGDRGMEELSEISQSGTGHICDVCRVWEDSARPVIDSGVRTVLLRIGIVLSPRGGALRKFLAWSPLGIIRRFGDGDQYISWISLDDAVSAMYHALYSEVLAGPVNIVAPKPVTNKAFHAKVARVTRKRLSFPLPARLLQAVYGDMAREILLSSTRVSCRKLLDSGFVFRYDDLDKALGDMFGIFDEEEEMTAEVDA